LSLSADCAPEFREYERTTTATVDAFLRPRVSSYLSNLADAAVQLGIADLHVMQSNGGIVPAHSAAANPLGMLRSGPAAGVAGAIAVAENAGYPDIVTMDMGGTSTDVAVVHAGEPEISPQCTIDGLPLLVPMLDIIALGAGGGSIVALDTGGLLTIGPKSAGAEPGPACYGRGGTLPTVTDANAVRGLIRPEAFLGGRHRLDREASVSALTSIAEQLGVTVEKVAEDVFHLASVQMAGAIRITTTERGYDAGQYTLVAYGGAGPLHAATVAEQLGMARVLVPPFPGLSSAYGLLTAGFRREYAKTNLINASTIGKADLASLSVQLEEIAREQLAEQNIDLFDATFRHSADVRYRGQGYEVNVAIPDTENSVADLIEAFHAIHTRRYGYADRGRAVQVVTLRLTVTMPRPPLQLPRIDVDTTLPVVVQEIIEDGSPVLAEFRHRRSMAVGEKQPGPAVLEDDTSTTFVPTGWAAHVDGFTNLILERS
jgi:N-methylhydantoinase A